MNKKFSSKKRLAIVLPVIGLLLVFCLFAAVYRVVRYKDTYYHKALAEAAGTSTVISAQPGNIVDANGTLLASSVKVYRLILDPAVLYETEENYAGSIDETVSLAAEAFSINEEELKQAFEEHKDSSYVRYNGNTILSQEQIDAYNTAVAAFQKEKTEYNENHDTGKISARVAGIWFEEEYRRSYPLNSVLSKIIGYTTADAATGLTGLEVKYNDVLRGTNGKVVNYVDTDGTISKDVEDAQDGYNLVTSLDSNVAEILQENIKEFEEEIGAERVNVLVMDPNNGEIIAMASDTDYDLNDPDDLSAFFTEEELEDPASTFLLQEAFKGKTDTLEAMTTDEQLEALVQQVQSNYCVSGTYEPGSTAKTMTLAAAIEEGTVNKDDTFTDSGPIDVSGYLIHCHNDDPCGELNPMEALGNSCNVCYVQIGQTLSHELFAKYQEIFNLGQKTGIDLPGEANTSSLVYTADTLGEIEQATCSFGQGFNVTMVQMASAYSSLVNGGYYYEPHVVTKITDSEGNTVKEIEPELVRMTVSQETSDYIRECLLYVTEHGTARTYFNTYGYSTGGKTGASEKLPRSEQKYVVSFIGVSPIENPDFLVYVVVEEPHVEDQSMSAPAQQLAKMIFSDLYTYMGVYPSYEENAYEYDWGAVTDAVDDIESTGGQSFIDDPDNTINWLEENTDTADDTDAE